MKRSHLVINLIYIVFFLSLITVSGILISNLNRSEWEAREETVRSSAYFASNDFYSRSALMYGAFSEQKCADLEKKIRPVLDTAVSSFSIRMELPETAEDVSLNHLEMQTSYLQSQSQPITMQLLCRIDYENTPCYLLLESDFSALSARCLKRLRYYSSGAAGISLLSAALLIFMNLLWKESEKNRKFVENFTHEMKTPMTSILGYTELLKTMDLNREDEEKALSALSFEARRLNNLSTQMLSLIITQSDAPELSAIPSAKIRSELSVPLSSLSDKYQIPFSLSLPDCTLFCNKDLLLLLITNLVDNAMKATVNAKRKDGVLISGKILTDTFQISIRDHGIGIPKKHLSRITEPFYRVDKARSRAQGGAGLGLALCSEIARLHGTTLSFSSRRGSGTKVSFFIRRTNA